MKNNKPSHLPNGVAFIKRLKSTPYISKIKVDKFYIHLGYYEQPEQAASVYQAAKHDIYNITNHSTKDNFHLHLSEYMQRIKDKLNEKSQLDNITYHISHTTTPYLLRIKRNNQFIEYSYHKTYELAFSKRNEILNQLKTGCNIKLDKMKPIRPKSLSWDKLNDQQREIITEKLSHLIRSKTYQYLQKPLIRYNINEFGIPTGQYYDPYHFVQTNGKFKMIKIINNAKQTK